MSCSNKGSSVREEICSVYGENLPVMFHIVCSSEEQLSSFTPWRKMEVCTIVSSRSLIRGLMSRDFFRLTGDGPPACSGSCGRLREKYRWLDQKDFESCPEVLAP